MNAPNAYSPPRAVRYQLTCGAALSAIVAIVPCVVDRRSAGRERRRRRQRAARHALHVARPQHDGQAERHHDERARETPTRAARCRRSPPSRRSPRRRTPRRRSRAPFGTCPGRRAAPAGIAGVPLAARDRFEHAHDVAGASAAARPDPSPGSASPARRAAPARRRAARRSAAAPRPCARRASAARCDRGTPAGPASSSYAIAPSA